MEVYSACCFECLYTYFSENKDDAVTNADLHAAEHFGHDVSVWLERDDDNDQFITGVLYEDLGGP